MYIISQNVQIAEIKKVHKNTLILLLRLSIIVMYMKNLSKIDLLKEKQSERLSEI